MEVICKIKFLLFDLYFHTKSGLDYTKKKFKKKKKFFLIGNSPLIFLPRPVHVRLTLIMCHMGPPTLFSTVNRMVKVLFDKSEN
jgi:hypothetical protein